MNDVPVSTTTPVAAAPRDTKSVAAILGAIVLLLVLGVLIAFCVKGSGGGAAADAVDGVRSGRIQAVYLTNDSVYFGHLGERSGDWLELRDGYYLRSTPDPKDATKAPTTEVVPVEQQAGGDGNLLINSREVVLVQNLKADSQIAKTIDDALS